MNCSYITVDELIELLKGFDGNEIVNVDFDGDFEIEYDETDNTINFIS